MMKQKRFRSSVYLAWVRTLPCCVTGRQGVEAHHVIGMYGLSGVGLKAPDSFVMPLAPEIHRQVHADPTMQWMQSIWLEDTINAGLEQFAEGPIHDALQEALEFVRERAA